MSLASKNFPFLLYLVALAQHLCPAMVHLPFYFSQNANAWGLFSGPDVGTAWIDWCIRPSHLIGRHLTPQTRIAPNAYILCKEVKENSCTAYCWVPFPSLKNKMVDSSYHSVAKLFHPLTASLHVSAILLSILISFSFFNISAPISPCSWNYGTSLEVVPLPTPKLK